jgi:oxygen-dependent protoporphyrinogen oxidase
MNSDISLYDFFTQHFGTECADYLLDPFIAGTYAGDPKKLSAKHTFPKLVKASESNGSIIRSLLSNKNRFKNKIISFKEGLIQLPIALSQSLKQKPLTDARLLEIKQENERWKIQFQIGNNDPQNTIFDAVYSTIPAHKNHTLPFLDSTKSDLPDFCSIEHPPVTVLSLGFRSDQFKKPLSGFGYLIPSKEKQEYLGVLFTSSIFKNRAPENHTLITVFIGGSRNPSMASLSESELISKLYPKIQKCLQIKGDPSFSYSRYWDHSIPQYTVNYDNIINQIEHFESKCKNFYLSGNYRNGIALGDCFSDFKLPV